MTNEEVVEELNADLKEVNFWLERYKSNGEVCEKREIRKVVLEAAIKALEQQKTGHWIEDAKTYYEELNKRGLGVDEYTPYFTDDIACSECLAKYSVIDNETQFFKHCPNCGADMRGSEEEE